MSALDLDLVRACFRPGDSLFLAPDIPAHREKGARDVHRLAADEPILALFDNTLVGNGRCGFVVTPRRLCWKNDFEAPDVLEWWELQAEAPDLPESHPPGLGVRVLAATNGEAPPMLAGFLRAVRTTPAILDAPAWLVGETRRVALLARRHLGKRDRIYYHPWIPAKKLETALKLHRGVRESGETVLVQYDDTFFGGGQDGFLATAHRLGWKNGSADPATLSWSALDPATLKSSGQKVRIGEDHLQVIMLTDGAPDVAAFFRACAAGDTVPEPAPVPGEPAGAREPRPPAWQRHPEPPETGREGGPPAPAGPGVPAGYRSCQSCGDPMPEDQGICTSCGALLPG